MRIRLEPTDSKLTGKGQHAVEFTTEHDDVGAYDIMDLMAAALIAYGYSQESVLDAMDFYMGENGEKVPTPEESDEGYIDIVEKQAQGSE